MWPKAIAQLIELLPHIARLLPVADRFLSAKTGDAEASRSAMEQMAAGLRGDLGQVTAAHAGLYRQLNEQSERLGDISAEMHSMKATVDLLEARLLQMAAQLRVLLLLCCIGVGCALIFGISLLLRH